MAVRTLFLTLFGYQGILMNMKKILFIILVCFVGLPVRAGLMYGEFIVYALVSFIETKIPTSNNNLFPLTPKYY